MTPTPASDSSGPTRRDPLAERVLLDHATRLSRLFVASFAQQAQERLEAGQALYGDQWASRPLTELLDECAEETLDTAAWAVLSAERLIALELDRETTATVSDMLAQAMAAGATAHAHITAARAAIRKACR